MVEFVSVAEARMRDGLRVVMVGGVPSPWGEAVKGILHVKQIPYVACRMTPEMPAVKDWTGHESAPIAVYAQEKPRTGWAEILLLAERLAPAPSLLPADPEERALCLGLCHEICGEEGLGWSRRLASIHASLTGEGGGFAEGVARYLGPKYGYRPEAAAGARRRVVELLGLFAARLRRQREAGRDYLLGEALGAADLYLATFMALFKPLPPEQCPIPDALRAAFETLDDAIKAALDPVLLEHRDRIYARHLELPLTL